MTIEQSLISPLEAEILLIHILKKDKIWLYKNPDFNLTTSQIKQYQKLVIRRVKGEPIAYITKHKEFYGLDFYVDERVLIPRPETEILVEEILKEIITKNPLERKNVIADIGTGSGCISVALATKLKIKKGGHQAKLKIYATDISKGALEVAKINAKKHKVDSKIKFLHGDLLLPLPEKIDLIVANLPYIDPTFLNRPTKDCWTLKKEPILALGGGKNGIQLIKKLLKQAPLYLKQEGKIFLEIDPRQKTALTKFISSYFPNSSLKLKKDLANLDRVALLKLS